MTPAAPHHLPWFITTPGESDGLSTAMVVFVIVAIFLIGTLFLYLYQLPMQYSRRGRRIHKVQAEIVAVLALIALFTGTPLFWVAGLLLALVQLPDLWTPINSMAQSLRVLATQSRPHAIELERKATPALEGSLPPRAFDELPGPVGANEPRQLVQPLQ